MPTIVHIDRAAEDTRRVKKFSAELLGWIFEGFPVIQDNLITTTNLDGTPGAGGGTGKRMYPSHHITNYFGVPSLDEAMKQARSLGGTVLSKKRAVVGMGFLANCVDTGGTMFGLRKETAQAR